MASAGMRGFPKKLKFIHKYVDSLGVQVSAGVQSIRQFSCNGLYDPDITSTGHQPIYFDNLTALYDHYTVFRSTITFRIALIQGGGASAALYVDDDTTTAAFAPQAAEQGTGTLNLVPYPTYKPVVLSKTWNAKEYFGGDIFDNDALSGSSAANPLEQSYFTLVLGSFDNLQFQYNLTVQIVYEAVWDELKTVGLS